MNSLKNIAILFLLTVSSSVFADIDVIVNSDNTYQISKRELVALYLGKTSTLKNGVPIIPLHQPENSNAYASFTKNILNRTKKQYKAYWAKKIFTGKGRPPKTVSDNNTMIERVAGDVKYIGYITDTDSDYGIRVIILN